MDSTDYVEQIKKYKIEKVVFMIGAVSWFNSCVSKGELTIGCVDGSIARRRRNGLIVELEKQGFEVEKKEKLILSVKRK